jgi:hypothetical protein
MLDLGHELARRSVAHDPEAPGLERQLALAGAEAADEDDLARALADVDEAAGAGEAGPEPGNIDVALGVGLSQAEEGDVEAAAVVEVELVGLVDDRLRVDGGAEVEAPGGHAADDARLGRQRQQVDHLFLVGHAGDALRHPDPEIDDAVRPELQRRAPGDHLAQAHVERPVLPRGHAVFARVGGVVGGAEGLRVVGGLGDDDAIDQDARDLDLARAERAALGDALDLHDHQPAAVARRHGDRQALERQGLALHGDVAVGIGGRAADDGDVDREGLVEEVLLAADRHQRQQLVDAPGV